MSKEDYWSANTRLITIVLAIWFVVSYLAGIVFVDQLNSIQIAGYKLGFWFAQQGAMYVFVVLIFWYSSKMDTLDKEYTNGGNN